MFNGNCSELSNGYITASKINKVIRKYGTWDPLQEFECIKYGICFTEQQKKSLIYKFEARSDQTCVHKPFCRTLNVTTVKPATLHNFQFFQQTSY